MQITLSTVVEAARQRKAALTAEAGGYIVLLAVQRLAAQPRQIAAELIQLTATGEILLDASGPAQAAETEAALRRLLATLLSLSHTAPPALRAAAERPAVGALAALEGELTAALIPINHAASGRALARLFRETDKALRGSPSLAAPASATTPVSSVLPVSTPAPASTASPVSSPSSQRRSGALEAAAAPPEPVVPQGSPSPSAQVVVQQQASPPDSAVVQDTSSLEFDVDVVASDEDEELAATDGGVLHASSAPGSSPVRSDAPQLIVEELDELELAATDGGVLRASSAPGSSPVRSDAPQLIVEELDELDLQELVMEELAPLAPAPHAEPAAAASAAAEPEALGRSSSEDEPAAEAREVADELDLLLASERPPAIEPPAIVSEPRLDLAPLCGEAEPPPSPPLDAPVIQLADSEPEPAPQRSDVRELLNGFLAYTRREEDMTANLRRMIGLEPWRASPGRAEGSKMGA